ncbi:hypothetical protein IAR50_005574 [Cryptococcus sp. DSM 104548]
MQNVDNRQQSFNAVAKPRSKAKPPFPLNPKKYPHLTPDSLAQAGFYHTPGSAEGSLDNCKCFLCNLELGGWDEEDDPFEEHAKRSNCAWAEMVCAVKVEKRKRDRDVKYETVYETEESLPQSAESIQVRIQTFKKWWPYKQKAGWLPTVKALARAGFVYNPSTESTDAVFCPYCEYGVEGWEATDDPWEIHQSKVPDCHFFRASSAAQLEESVSKTSRSKNSLAPSKRSKRATTAATAPSEAEETDLEPEHIEAAEEPASQTTTASKRAAKPRATTTSKPKGGRGKKKAATAEPEAEPEPQIPSESEGELEQAEPEPRSDVEMESQAEDQEPTPVKKPKGRPKATKATEKKLKASKAKGRGTKAVEEEGSDAHMESEAESQAQQTEPEEEPEQTTPKATQPSTKSHRSKPSSRSAKPPSQPSSQPSKPSSQPAKPPSQRSKPPSQTSQPSHAKPLPSLPPSSLPAAKSPAASSPFHPSQLNRFANIPPSSPVVTPRNIATLRTGQPSSRVSPHVPLNRTDQDSSVERGARSAQQVMDELLTSPALASPARRIPQASRSPLGVPESYEPGQLPEEIMSMTLEDLVRQEMKKAYEKLRNEGESKIEQWAERAAAERKKIEAL